MARAKAKYSGQILAGKIPTGFTDKLKETLRGYYPYKDAVEDPVWGHPADIFVSQILEEASVAISMLFHMQADTTTEEICLECDDLLKVLNSAEHKLRNISPDFDRIISNDATPLDCADQIKQMISFIEIASLRVNKLGKTQRLDSKRHKIALEMSIRVLRVLKDNGICPSEYVGTEQDDYCMSDAVKILEEIGGDIGINMVATTWRTIIGEAKEHAPDLRRIYPPEHG